MRGVMRFTGMSGRLKARAGRSSFMQILSFPLPVDGALLLCSDGLTDLITSEEIRAGVERYAPDYEAAILALIDAANHAGGKDNITVVVVASPGYNPQPPLTVDLPAIPAARRDRRWLPVAAGLAVGAALGAGVPMLWTQFTSNGPKTWTVDQSGINAAISRAHPGDTVVIPEGKYREQIHLREGVTVRVQRAGTVTVSSPGAGPAVIANRIESGSIEGVRVLRAIPVRRQQLVSRSRTRPSRCRMCSSRARWWGLRYTGGPTPSWPHARLRTISERGFALPEAHDRGSWGI